jgi:methylmalonyl-CoA mutase cobalamin-binding domain/chain
MNNASWKETLTGQMAELQIGKVLELVNECLEEGENPLEIIEVCKEGVRRVGELYEKGDYFLAGLIMAGEILRQVLDRVLPLLPVTGSGSSSGLVLMGTVQGDIHDIGKNLAQALFRCQGFNVLDLGVDVPPSEIVRQVRANQPDIVGLSAFLTTGYGAMRETVRLIRETIPAGGQPSVIIVGGGLMNEQVCHYTGADLWTRDAVEGVRKCQDAIRRNLGAGGG